MNRAELIEFIAAETDLSKAATGRLQDVLPETIQKTVKQGEALQLVLHASTKRAARTPRTDEARKIPAATVPKVLAGAEFKAVMDPKAAQIKAAKAAK